MDESLQNEPWVRWMLGMVVVPMVWMAVEPRHPAEQQPTAPPSVTVGDDAYAVAVRAQASQPAGEHTTAAPGGRGRALLRRKRCSWK